MTKSKSHDQHLRPEYLSLFKQHIARLLQSLWRVKMRFFTTALAAVPFLSSLVSATALTYKLAANEKACFFEDISRENSKVAFYFAVR